MSVLASAAPAALASLGATALTTFVVHEAAANPPPPKVLPDPPVSAPTADEAPTVVRKHEGLCFALYPSGGALPVTCPSELLTEPLGQAILKNQQGRCQWIPFQSGGPGRTGFLAKCPSILAEIAKANVIPEASKRLLEATAAARAHEEVQPWVDPPQPARLDSQPRQQVGCAGCATGAGGDATGAVATAVAAAAVAATGRRRRRR